VVLPDLFLWLVVQCLPVHMVLVLLYQACERLIFLAESAEALK